MKAIESLQTDTRLTIRPKTLPKVIHMRLEYVCSCLTAAYIDTRCSLTQEYFGKKVRIDHLKTRYQFKKLLITLRNDVGRYRLPG